MKHRFLFFFYGLLSACYGLAQMPSPNFKADVTAGCAPIVVKFTDLSTGGPTSWEWDLGNGTISNLQNPAATYLDPGKYKVTLKATNASGTATLVKDTFITVYNKPVTAFNVNTRSGCTPAPLQFTDASTAGTGSVVSWKWDFGDSYSSTEQNPQHIYRIPGSYTVTLTTVNDKGCTNLHTEPNYVDIIKGVVPNFKNSGQIVCKPPVNIQFTNLSTGPATLSYFWDLGNGETSTEKDPKTVYNTVGSFPVKLIVTSSYGCTDTLIRPGAISTSQIITDFGVPVVCPNTEVQFFDSSSAFSISNLWKFSDGTTDSSASPYKTYATPGTYSVTLINYYPNCTDSVTKNVQVDTNPTVDFTASPLIGCKIPFSVSFTASGGGANQYEWDFGDNTGGGSATTSHLYNNFGSYNVKLTATSSHGCIATTTKPAYVRIQKPVIRFTNLPDHGCIPYTISPKSTVETIDSISSYHWDFGDGGTADTKLPTYTYTKTGKYKVSLTITTVAGCVETYSLEEAIKVGTKPTADFTFDKSNICARDAVQFSEKASVDADEWKWDFGDGSTSNEKNPSHEFNDIGPLVVSLEVSNTGCKSDVVKKTVTIKAPIAVFSYKPTTCDDLLNYSFINQSVTGSTGTLTWKWNFGDGDTSTLKDPPPHKYAALGTYTVSLYVSNGECDYTMKRTLKLAKYVPDFVADVRSGCSPLQVLFTPTNPADTMIKEYIWDFGDGTTAKSPLDYIRHTYTDTGDFKVTLITKNIYACSDSAIPKPKYIHVNGVKAKFSSTTNQGCIGLTTTFLDQSSASPQTPIVSWKWNWGDRTSQTYTAPPFQHTYDKVARYDVSLVVTDAAGCKDSVTYDNFVRTSSYKMEWNGTRQTCPGAPADFTSVSNTRNYKTLWDFGNGITANSNGPAVRYHYPDTGTYTLKLVIIDTLGCRDSLIKPNYIRVYRPVANFTANNFATYCIPFEMRLKNNSSYYTSSKWDLGIGTSTQTNPVSYYTSRGTYNIKLTVTSPGGCTDDTTQVLNVYDASDGKLTYGPLNFNCRPMKVDFNSFSDINGSFVWDFGDGTVVDTPSHTITHNYNNVGDFTPKVILRQPDGCLVPLTGSAPVRVDGANIKFNIDKRFFCDSGRIQILDSTKAHGSSVNYSWDFGDGTTSTVPNPGSHLYTKPGWYPLRLVVKTGAGCVDSMAIRPGVRVSLTPIVHIDGDTVICVNQFAKSGGIFDRRDTSFIRWAWQFPNGATSSVQLPPDQQYKTAGQFQVQAIVSNAEGCAYTATKPLLVHPLPTSTLPSAITIQPGFPAQIQGDYSPNVVSYTWRPANGLSCTDCPNPVASPKFNTKYVVQFVDSNGCMNTNLVQIIVICKNANVFVPNTFSPNGDGKNDVFFVRGRGLDRVKSLRIFDRWGEVVFERKDFPVNNSAEGWDGRYKGVKLKPDVYVYQVEVFCENAEVIRFEGNVALIQ